VRALEPPPKGKFLVYHDGPKRLAIAVYASGGKVWKFIYSWRGKPTWKTIGSFEDWNVKRACDEAERLGGRIADKVNPQHEHMEAKKADSFGQLAFGDYMDYAEKNVKSSGQTMYMLSRLPQWFQDMRTPEITRADIAKVLLPVKLRAPATARRMLAAISSVMEFGVEETCVLDFNPCTQIKRPPDRPHRTRMLEEGQLPLFWREFANYQVAGTALKFLILVGQRPGEVCHLRWEHLRDGSWHMPGLRCEGWLGTKNSCDHIIWVPAAAMALIADRRASAGYVFSERPDLLHNRMRKAMRKISEKLGVQLARPHDCRRTHGTTVTRLLGIKGRVVMDRIQNHRKKSQADAYDMFAHTDEIKRVMEQVAAEILRLAEGREQAENVVALRQ
jgi:integrase